MRTLFVGVATVLVCAGLCGCGGSSFHGTLNGGSGSGPTPATGQPVVTGVSPSTVVAGGAGFTLTVTGTNFAQGDTVEWTIAPLASKFVSTTEMTAQVTNDYIVTATSATIIVQPPVPYSLNFGADVTVTDPPPPGTAGFTASTATVQANDMAWDPVSQRIYLSVAGTNPTSPNTITALNPVNAQFDASISAGSGADRLAVSSDGSWLYAGIDAAGTVQRFTVPGLARDITIPLGAASVSHPNYAFALEAAPGSPNTIAVSQASSSRDAGAVVIYDGSTPRSAGVAPVGGVLVPLGSLAWSANAANLYASYDQYSDNTLYVLAVNSTGAQFVQTDMFDPPGQSYTLGSVHYSALTGYIYSSDEQILSPSTDKVINRLPLAAVDGGFAYSRPRLTLDDNLGMAWIVGQPANSTQYVIEAFDLKTYALLGSISIPNVVGSPVKLIRWGSNGLAFLTTGSNGPQQGDGVYIISGAFVTNPTVQVRPASGLQN